MKVIDEVRIYECTNCQLGFVDQAKIIKQNLNSQYQLREYKKEEKMIVSRLNPIVDNIVKYKSSGSVLEIGPGHGLLSSLLLKRGKFKLDIVEPNLTPHYLPINSFTLHKIDLDGFLKINKKKFDLIIMFDVIEHLKDPLASLFKIKKIIKEGGVLVIQTPNYQSLMQWMTKKWSWWMIEDHKWFFSPASLQKSLKKNDLNKVYEYTYEDWTDFKKNLDGNFTHLKNSPFRKLVKAIFFAIFVPFYFITRKLFWKMGNGGLILVVTRLDTVDNRHD